MFRPLTTLLGMSLIAGSALYLPANATTNAGQTQLSFSQSPPEVATVNYKAVLEQETRLVEEQKHVIPGTAIYARKFGRDEANRLAKDGVLIGCNSADSYLDLQSGNVLLTPEKILEVATNKAKISVAAGATVFITVSTNNVVVYDLLQTKPKQVSITLDKHKLLIEPGQMLVITVQNISDFEKLDATSHCVTHRKITPCTLSNQTVNAFLAEFSMASAMTTIQPLQRLTVSNHREDQLVLEKLIKVSVLLGDFATSTEAVPQVAESGARKISEVGQNN